MDRNLIKYLPYEVRKYKDYQVITDSENPEFTKIFNISKEILDESFIESSTEYGVSRLEKIVGIYPDVNDSLEDRKVNLLIWWNNYVPYTWRVLIEKLNSICGVGKYDIKLFHNEYILEIDSQLNTPNQYENLRILLDTIIPANMVIISTNTLKRKNKRNLYLGQIVNEFKKVTIDNNINVNNLVNRNMNYDTTILEFKKVTIDNNININTKTNLDMNLNHTISSLKYIKINMEELI